MDIIAITRDIDPSDTSHALSRFDCNGYRIWLCILARMLHKLVICIFVLAGLFHYFRLSDRIVEHW